MQDKKMKNKKLIANLVFVIIGIIIIVILKLAPEPTTPVLPYDDNHKKFFIMKKKEAEKYCDNCHKQLPENHPPKLRCLLCHREVKK